MPTYNQSRFRQNSNLNRPHNVAENMRTSQCVNAARFKLLPLRKSNSHAEQFMLIAAFIQNQDESADQAKAKTQWQRRRAGERQRVALAESLIELEPQLGGWCSKQLSPQETPHRSERAANVQRLIFLHHPLLIMMLISSLIFFLLSLHTVSPN